MSDLSKAAATAGMYKQYIACLNARTLNKLDQFVTPDVVHNGRALGLDGYRAMLEENFRDIPDLYFNADLVLANENHVASRLRFDCTPVKNFLGVAVNGRRILFYEHAFYALSEGKVGQVFSVIDKTAVEAQARP
jgi:Predicted ester cyclase